jgi:hypothetical protein
MLGRIFSWLAALFRRRDCPYRSPGCGEQQLCDECFNDRQY